MSTALYHSLIKPCFGDDESPFWPTSGPFAFDVCTMWDIYKTQLPLLMAITPNRAADLLESLIRVCEEEGNFPIGYRMARGADRFFRQAQRARPHRARRRALARASAASTGLGAGAHGRRPAPPVRRGLLRARRRAPDHATRSTWPSATTAPRRSRGRWATSAWPTSWTRAAGSWVNAFDPTTGLLRDSEFYEGGKWNYSFRLLHDMRARIALAGGDDAFVAMLDEFFGFGAGAVTQPGRRPLPDGDGRGLRAQPVRGAEQRAGHGGAVGLPLRRPSGPDRRGRPRRAAPGSSAPGAGGLPGNDDSGGLSSWYVWASLGLFPVAGQSLFLVNAPAFARSALRVDGGEFVVETTGHRETPSAPTASRRHRPFSTCRPATFNGRPLETTYIRAADVHNGGVLHLELGPEPSPWGRSVRPPSLSDARPGGATA